MKITLTSRCIGFFGSLLLTLTAYFLITRPGLFSTSAVILTLFILAIVQFVLQSICFLNIWNGTGARWNLVIFLSTVSIILIILGGTLWIMHHLNYHMMH